MKVWTAAARRVAPMTILALALGACAGGDAAEEAAEPAESTPSMTAAPEAPPADVITDLREIDWAPELEIDLDAMERRESGLYVQVLQTGSGSEAGYGDEMGVHYTVWLPNGFKVDSSHDGDPPEPLDMVLGQTRLIDGWVEGVTGMRLGEKRKLVLPYDLAYGARGRDPIPPYSPLVFEVELATHREAGT